MATRFLVLFIVSTPNTSVTSCPDITKLGLYTASNPEFMYYDIQFRKGKSRNPQKMLVTFTNTGDSLEVMYRITPCV